MTRREAREQAFMVLFEKTFSNETTIREIIETAEEAELIKINSFADALLVSVENNIEAIDKIIEDNSRGWTIQRLPKVSLAVLRLAIGEMMYSEDVPTGVAVNEAVELMKKYGTSDDASYVNGVLGTVAKAL